MSPVNELRKADEGASVPDQITLAPKVTDCRLAVPCQFRKIDESVALAEGCVLKSVSDIFFEPGLIVSALAVK